MEISDGRTVAVPVQPIHVSRSRWGRPGAPLAALGLVTVPALLATALVYLLVQVHQGVPSPPLVIHVVTGLLLAGVVAAGIRWTPALGALYGAYLIFELFTRLRP